MIASESPPKKPFISLYVPRTYTISQYSECLVYTYIKGFCPMGFDCNVASAVIASTQKALLAAMYRHALPTLKCRL